MHMMLSHGYSLEDIMTSTPTVLFVNPCINKPERKILSLRQKLLMLASTVVVTLSLSTPVYAQSSNNDVDAYDATPNPLSFCTSATIVAAPTIGRRNNDVSGRYHCIDENSSHNNISGGSVSLGRNADYNNVSGLDLMARPISSEEQAIP